MNVGPAQFFYEEEQVANVLLKRITGHSSVQNAIGCLAAGYLKFVASSSRKVLFSPDDFYDQLEHCTPCIIAAWHGKHFLVPLAHRKGDTCRALISLSSEGSIYAQIAKRMGLGVIRGSGQGDSDWREKGGFKAFREMLRTLEVGSNIGITPDRPRRNHAIESGILKLAQLSERPIVPVAATATCHTVLHFTPDQMTIDFPFSRRLVFAVGTPIYVPTDADDTVLDDKRKELRDALNQVNDTADQIAGSR